jgi:hypothetical protein
MIAVIPKTIIDGRRATRFVDGKNAKYGLRLNDASVQRQMAIRSMKFANTYLPMRRKQR